MVILFSWYFNKNAKEESKNNDAVNGVIRRSSLVLIKIHSSMVKIHVTIVVQTKYFEAFLKFSVKCNLEDVSAILVINSAEFFFVRLIFI